MKQNWTLDELIDSWTLSPNETTFVKRYKTATNQVAVALLLKYFQLVGRFPYRRRDIPRAAIEFLTRQMQQPATCFTEYRWRGRSITRHRSEIRGYLGFRQGTVADVEHIDKWLRETILPHKSRLESIMAAVYARYREQKIEPPTAGRVERIVRSAQRRYSEQFCATITAQLSEETKQALDNLLKRDPDEEGNVDGYSPFARLKQDTGKVSLKNILTETAKLTCIQQINLPDNLFEPVPAHIIQAYHARVRVERPREVLRHPDNIRFRV